MEVTTAQPGVQPTPIVIRTSAARQRQLRGTFRESSRAASIGHVGTAFRQYRVFYLVGGREQKTAWFSSEKRARTAFNIVCGRGHQAVIYCD